MLAVSQQEGKRQLRIRWQFYGCLMVFRRPVLAGRGTISANCCQQYADPSAATRYERESKVCHKLAIVESVPAAARLPADDDSAASVPVSAAIRCVRAHLLRPERIPADQRSNASTGRTGRQLQSVHCAGCAGRDSLHHVDHHVGLLEKVWPPAIALHLGPGDGRLHDDRCTVSGFIARPFGQCSCWQLPVACVRSRIRVFQRSRLSRTTLDDDWGTVAHRCK